MHTAVAVVIGLWKLMFLKAFKTATAIIKRQYHISDVTNNSALSYGIIKKIVYFVTATTEKCVTIAGMYAVALRVPLITFHMTSNKSKYYRIKMIRNIPISLICYCTSTEM